MSLSIEPALDFGIFNSESMVEQIAKENNVMKFPSRNSNEIDALSSLFASKLNFGSAPYIPKVLLHSNGNVMVEMPYIEGQLKTKYIFSKEMFLNSAMRLFPFLVFGQSTAQENDKKTMAVLPSNEALSEIITEIVQQRDDQNNVDTSDSDDDTASTDSSPWESPLSPTTFHKQMALLLEPKPACARNLFN